jgi:hypothetical protein
VPDEDDVVPAGAAGAGGGVEAAGLLATGGAGGTNAVGVTDAVGVGGTAGAGGTNTAGNVPRHEGLERDRSRHIHGIVSDDFLERRERLGGG